MSRLAGAVLCSGGFVLTLAPLVSTDVTAYLVLVVGTVAFLVGTGLLIFGEAWA